MMREELIREENDNFFKKSGVKPKLISGKGRKGGTRGRRNADGYPPEFNYEVNEAGDW